MIKKITEDFETQSECNLKKAGAFEYSVDPSTKPLCFAFKIMGAPKVYLLDYYLINSPWAKLPQKFKDLWTRFILEGFQFSAHNQFFETSIYENILVKRLGWPAIPRRQLRCTAAKAASVAIPRSLADAGAVMRTSIQKDFEGHRIMMKLCKPTAAWNKWHNKWLKEKKKGHDFSLFVEKNPEPFKFWTPETAPEDFKKLYEYCKIDVLAEEKLDEALPDLSPFEQELWFIDQKINLRGIAVDMPLVKKISEIMAKEAKIMNRELDLLTMGLVSSGNARAAIIDFLALEGLELPNLQAKTVDDFLKNGKATGDAEKILQIRRALAKSSTAKYQTFLIRAASDGRVRDLLMFLGAARTGRWGGKGIQPQNFPRGIIKDIYEAIDRIKTGNVEDLKLLYGENLMPLFSSVLRGMFISSPKNEMFVEDFSAIECRILFWLAGHKEGLKIFAQDRDPYVEMAAKLYNKSLLEITNEQRQVGKATILGCGFGMGNRKFVSSAFDVYRAEVTKDQAKVAVTAYRELHWPVVELWESFQECAIGAVETPGVWCKSGKVGFIKEGRFLKIRLPSGRFLSYCDPKIEAAKTIVLEKVIGNDVERLYASTPTMLEKARSEDFEPVGHFYSKRLTYFEVNQKARKEDCVIPKWTIERTYGGKLVENIVQAVSRDLLGAAIVRADKAGFEVLMHSHDELVSEAPKGKFTSEQYRKIMTTLPKWAEGLPVKSGGWVNNRYKKG